MSQMSERNSAGQPTRVLRRSRFLWAVIVLLIVAAIWLAVAVGYNFWLVYLKTNF